MKVRRFERTAGGEDPGVRTVTTSDAILVVSASRFGYPGILAEFLVAAGTPLAAADLALALGEVAAAVDGVTIALSGQLPASSDGRDLDSRAELIVRCAADGDHAGIEAVCVDAANAGRLTALLCALVSGINSGLDRLDRLPGPGATGLLERLGVAAATRTH